MISDINQETVHRYFSKLLLEEISPQSYNNKIKAVTDFLVYLQRVQIVDSFPIRVDLFEKKGYPVVKRYPSLQEQLVSLSEYVYDFPKPLCVMSCILLYTGIDKGKLFQLKDSATLDDLSYEYMKEYLVATNAREDIRNQSKSRII